MKKSIKRLRIIILLASFLSSSIIFAQTLGESKYNFNLQLGASTPFGFPTNSSIIVPQLGLGFNTGIFGIRATGQFFKTSPEFDIDAYLAPISSYITQSGEEKHSNILLGISPYLNLPLKGITLQPALGLNYLIQNGATLMADYGNLAPGAILDASVGDEKRSVFILSPNIRAVIGKPNKALKFFVEAGYSMAASSEEYSLSYMNLEGVILPDGSLDPDLMGNAKTVVQTEKIMPSSPWLAIGLELNIMSSPDIANWNTSRSNKVGN